MGRLEQHRVRRHLEPAGVEVFERLNDGGDEVRATADRFRQDDVRTVVRFKLADLADEVVEPAAEARARYFLHAQPLGAERVGIDEVVRLVVGDHADFLALRLIVLGEPGDGGRLAGPRNPPIITNRTVTARLLEYCDVSSLYAPPARPAHAPEAPTTARSRVCIRRSAC